MTAVQRKVVLFMHQCGGRAYIATGHKTVEVGCKVASTGEHAVKGNMNLTFGLKNQGLARRCGEAGTPDSRRWELTEKAKVLIANMRKREVPR